jgi:hypothetical protein
MIHLRAGHAHGSWVLDDQPPAVLAAARRARPLLDRGDDNQLGRATLTFGQPRSPALRQLWRDPVRAIRPLDPLIARLREPQRTPIPGARHVRVSLGFKPRAAAHWRNTFIAVEIFPRLAITTASRYGIRPWRQSSTRRGSSQPRPTSTSIEVTNLRSASAASAARTTRRSSLPPEPRGTTPHATSPAKMTPTPSLRPWFESEARGDLRCWRRCSRMFARCLSTSTRCCTSRISRYPAHRSR